MRRLGTRRADGGPEHDSGYKLLFSHPRMVEALAGGFFPDVWREHLDFGTLERSASSFVHGDFRERHGDLVWRLHRRDVPNPVYLLFEFQSTPDPFMPLRLLAYVSLLLQDLVRKGGHRLGEPLPAVLPVVLYNGRPAWRAPLEATALFGPLPSGWEGYVPGLRHLFLDEKALDLDRPDLAGNLAAAVFRIETSRTPDDFQRRLQEMLDLLRDEEDMELRATLTAWLRRKVRKVAIEGIIFPDLEDATMFEDMLIEWGRKKRREGRIEGQRKGRIEGMRRLLLSLMSQRFGRLPAAVRQRVESLDNERELQRLAVSVLEAGSLAELSLG